MDPKDSIKFRHTQEVKKSKSIFATNEKQALF